MKPQLRKKLECCAIKQKILKILATSDLADVVFVVADEGKYRAHKLILMWSSPLFRKQFSENGPYRASSVIRIKGTPPRVFGLFLVYLYVKEFIPLNNPVVMEDLIGLIKVADEHELPDLKEKCCEDLYNMIFPNTVMQLLVSARQLKMGNLESACKNFINRHPKAVIKSEAFKNCDSALLQEILNSNSLNITEIDLFEAVLGWAKANCKQQTPTKESIRAVLGDALYLIRFPVMSVGDLRSIKDKDEILTDHEHSTVSKYISESRSHTADRLKDHPPFPTKRRRFVADGFYLNRFDGKYSMRTGIQGNGCLYQQGLRISVDKLVYLRGVRIYGIKELGASRGEFIATLEAHEDSHSSIKHRKTVDAGTGKESRVLLLSTPALPSPEYFHILLDDELALFPEKTYTIMVNVDVKIIENKMGEPIVFRYFSGRGLPTTSFSNQLNGFTFNVEVRDIWIKGSPCFQIPELLFNI